MESGLITPKVSFFEKLTRRYMWDCSTFRVEPLRSDCCEECGRGCEYINLDEWHKIKKLRKALKESKEFSTKREIKL